jgi:hypothetical protein
MHTQVSTLSLSLSNNFTSFFDYSDPSFHSLGVFYVTTPGYNLYRIDVSPLSSARPTILPYCLLFFPEVNTINVFFV